MPPLLFGKDAEELRCPLWTWAQKRDPRSRSNPTSFCRRTGLLTAFVFFFFSVGVTEGEKEQALWPMAFTVN